MLRVRNLGKGTKAALTGALLVGGLLSSTLPALADVTPPPVAELQREIIGSGSDTTYDLMKNIDKLYAGANGCATIWADSAQQPFDGSCDPASAASGNNTTDYPWVNANHDTATERYPVGSGNGIKELCRQGLTNIHPVDFARSSSGAPTLGTEACSDLKYVAYAKDAVSWWHATKDKTGADTHTSTIGSLSTTVLGGIYTGQYTTWDQLNGVDGVKDTNGLAISVANSNALPSAPIVVYTVQAGSGTLSFWKGKVYSSGAIVGTAKSTGQENNANPIFVNDDESNAIYFYSFGRFRQAAGITATNDYFGNSVATSYPLARDTLGKVNDVAPTPANIQGGTFAFSRSVYNVLRYPSEKTSRYLGTSGFLCSSTMETIHDRITTATYRSLIDAAISAEGFVPLTKGNTGGSAVGQSYCRLTEGQADTTAPTVGIKTGATFTGLATGTLEFSKAVRSIDTTKLGAFDGDTQVPATYICYNNRGDVVADCLGGTANNDPYNTKVIKTVKVTLQEALVLGRTAVFKAQAGAGTDAVALTSGAFADTNNITGLTSVAAASTTRTGTWANITGGKSSATKNATASAPFAGASVAVTFVTGPKAGKVQIKVDGVVKQTVDLYTTKAGTVKKTVTGLAAGTHTVQLLVTGTKNAKSGGLTVGFKTITVS